MTTPKEKSLPELLQELQKDLDDVGYLVEYAEEYLDCYKGQKKQIAKTMKEINKLVALK